MNGTPTSLVIGQPTSFDDYVRQLMIPTRVLELARKASSIRFSAWEAEAIRASIAPGDGLLRRILELKARADDSHPPYIRVACTGNGDYDRLAAEYGYKVEPEPEPKHEGDFGSPVVLELWPAQHYSPMHSHGDTTGIIYSLFGQIDVMAYGMPLAWEAEKVALVTMTPGQCAWLDGERFAVHKVFCPMDGGPKPVGPGNLLNDSSNYAATFHVYLNPDELPLVRAAQEPKPDTRDIFEYIDEKPPHELKKFDTYSDVSWRVLRRVMADYAAKIGM